MAKIIPFPVPNRRLPRRLVNDGWWLVVAPERPSTRRDHGTRDAAAKPIRLLPSPPAIKRSPADDD